MDSDLFNASLYRKMGKPEQALSLYEESIKIFKEVLGTQHPNYASSLNNLALFYKAIGDYEKALPLYEESLGILTKVLGEQHPNTQTIMMNYFGCLAASKGLTLEELLENVEKNLTGFDKPVRFESEGNKISRNDPCPCGSSKKYKRCCGKLS